MNARASVLDPDVIADVLDRISRVADVPADAVRQVERESRQYWGGERCYIAKAGESPRRREAHTRAEQIRADHRRGERIALLARRHELSERHVRRILGIVDAVTRPAANDTGEHRPLPTRRSRRRNPDTGLA